MSEDEYARRGIDLDKPNPARVYDYILGGQLNYAVDRMFADQVVRSVVAPKMCCAGDAVEEQPAYECKPRVVRDVVQ